MLYNALGNSFQKKFFERVTKKCTFVFFCCFRRHFSFLFFLLLLLSQKWLLYGIIASKQTHISKKWSWTDTFPVQILGYLFYFVCVFSSLFFHPSASYAFFLPLISSSLLIFTILYNQSTDWSQPSRFRCIYIFLLIPVFTTKQIEKVIKVIWAFKNVILDRS